MFLVTYDERNELLVSVDAIVLVDKNRDGTYRLCFSSGKEKTMSVDEYRRMLTNVQQQVKKNSEEHDGQRPE